eukprot:1368618-Rhodomonas_salina.1
MMQACAESGKGACVLFRRARAAVRSLAKPASTRLDFAPHFLSSQPLVDDAGDKACEDGGSMRMTRIKYNAGDDDDDDRVQ